VQVPGESGLLRVRGRCLGAAEGVGGRVPQAAWVGHAIRWVFRGPICSGVSLFSGSRSGRCPLCLLWRHLPHVVGERSVALCLRRRRQRGRVIVLVERRYMFGVPLWPRPIRPGPSPRRSDSQRNMGLVLRSPLLAVPVCRRGPFRFASARSFTLRGRGNPGLLWPRPNRPGPSPPGTGGEEELWWRAAPEVAGHLLAPGENRVGTVPGGG